MSKPDEDTEDVATLGPDVGPGRLALRQRNGNLEMGLFRPVREGGPIEGELVTLDPRSDGAYDVKTVVKGPAKVNSPAFRAGWGEIFGGGSKKSLPN